MCKEIGQTLTLSFLKGQGNRKQKSEKRFFQQHNSLNPKLGEWLGGYAPKKNKKREEKLSLPQFLYNPNKGEEKKKKKEEERLLKLPLKKNSS